VKKDVDDFNIKLIEFFDKLSISDISNIEEVDLSGNLIDNNFIRNLIENSNWKSFFQKLKKLNLSKSNFSSEKKRGSESSFSIEVFFDIIKDSIEELDLSSSFDFSTAYKTQDLLNGLKKCQKLKKLNLAGSLKVNGDHLSSLMEIPNLLEIDLSLERSQAFDVHRKQIQITQFANKLKDHENLQKLTITILDQDCLYILADSLIFNYSLQEIIPKRMPDKLSQILQRNQIIFIKSKELYGEDNGSLLGKKLKEIRVLLDTKKFPTNHIKKIMDILIIELLQSREPNVGNLINKVDSYFKSKSIVLNTSLKDIMEINFKKLFEDKKRMQPDAESSGQGGPKKKTSASQASRFSGSSSRESDSKSHP
jgi:hypothetical protein